VRKRYILYAGVVVFLVSLLSGIKLVRPGERAVVRRLGRVVATPEPGLWMGLPWGLDRFDLVSIRFRRLAVGFDPKEEEDGQSVPRGQLLTGDHNLVNVQVIIDYAVDEANLVDFVEQAQHSEGAVARAAAATMAEWVAGRTVDEVLVRGQSELPRAL